MRYTFTSGVKFKGNGERIMPHEVITARRIVLGMAATKFGGATATIGIGSYLNSRQETVIEPCITFTIITKKPASDVLTLVEVLKALLSQESVLLTEDDTATKFV